jgi:ABC-type methionine transport system permease subunit
MKQLSTGLYILAIFFFVSFVRPIQAQTEAGTTRVAGSLGSDVAEEVTITGTVSSVLMKAAPGMIVGSHLLLATPFGPADASLGRFGFQGNGAVSVAAGQQIEATGVMKTIKDKPIFLVRTMKVSGEVYTIRNEHGVPVSPQARERAGHNTSLKGESR